MNLRRSKFTIAALLAAEMILPAAGSTPKGPGHDTDSRLLRRVTLHEKGIALADFCADLQAQTGVELSASQAVADEKVTVFVENRPARDVMREVGRLFSYFWSRSGSKSKRRYVLEQDLKSQLAEEELRNRDQHAALLALDQEMESCRPFLDLSFREFFKKYEQLYGRLPRSEHDPMGKAIEADGWGGMQLYFRLTPLDRAALSAGKELVFRPNDPNPDHRLTEEFDRQVLLSWNPPLGGGVWPTKDVPDAKVMQIRLLLNRSELGQVALRVTTSAQYVDSSGPHPTYGEADLATGRSPSVANSVNAVANGKLRGKAPLNLVVALLPKPSCPPQSERHGSELGPWIGDVLANRDLSRACATSADAWEAVHRATGLPIVADFYTHLFPVSKLTVDHASSFQVLCQVGDAIGARWTMDGEFLLCRSTSYFWDKLKEVPNRYLQRWARNRDANGGLPFADFLEMASMTDEALDSAVVADGIDRYWKLHEWTILNPRETRYTARYLSSLAPEQLQRALQPDGLPLPSLTPTQQQGAMQMQLLANAAAEREGHAPIVISAEWRSHALVGAKYIPAGWYAWERRSDDVYGPAPPIGGRTPAEALAAVRRLYPPARPEEVKFCRVGWFSGGISFFFRNN